MLKKKSTKKALLMNATSLLLGCSMFVGTTFAWFTDSVTSANNVIQSGNLDAEVYYGDPADKESISGVSELFDDVALWEPGAVAYENLTVVNEGSLALKYRMNVNFINENYIVDGGYCLSEILKVGLVEGGLADGLDRNEAIVAVTQWLPLESLELTGELDGKTSDETLGMVIYWQPSETDNNYNVNNGKTTSDGKDYLHIDLGITLVATQLAREEDSFDETYDEEAKFPYVATGELTAGTIDGLTFEYENITVNVPSGAPEGFYEFSVTDYSYEHDDDNLSILHTNIDLKKDGEAVDPNFSYDVNIELPLMIDITKVLHKSEEITDYTYDPFYGILSFTTDSFSPFTVEYNTYGTEVVVDAEARTISRGFFREVNPATLDASLLGDDSEYVAVDYTKDGETCYAVSERATTVVVSNTVTEYAFKNGNVPVTKIENGKLYKVFSDLAGNEHSTVYILPGTYNEATTLSVTSNMDIVGLGDAEDIKIVKVPVHTTKDKVSNRHLFNCTNSNPNTYIEVTIRNLHLTAIEKNSYMGTFFGKPKQMFEDNAAVQSIRRSKVKCYDLIIDKDEINAPSKAFYVNADNKVDDGKKYPAYMYVENCVVNSKNSNRVVDTKGKYFFYYSDLYYAKGSTAYSITISDQKNQVLEWNDWDWEN